MECPYKGRQGSLMFIAGGVPDADNKVFHGVCGYLCG
jgi:hypothetical protein